MWTANVTKHLLLSKNGSCPATKFSPGYGIPCLCSRPHIIAMREIPDSQLLQNEARVYRHTSQTLSKLAENLYSAGKILESKASQIDRKCECVVIGEARRRRTLSKIAKSDYDEEAREKREMLERRSIVSAMIAANTLKQEKIVNTAIQSLLDSDAGLLVDNDHAMKGAGGQLLSQLDPDQMPTFVCYLSAEMLTDPRLTKGLEKAEKAEPPTSLEYGASEGTFNDDEDAAFIESALSNLEEQRPRMPDVGFVTASGWVAISRRQH